MSSISILPTFFEFSLNFNSKITTDVCKHRTTFSVKDNSLCKPVQSLTKCWVWPNTEYDQMQSMTKCREWPNTVFNQIQSLTQCNVLLCAKCYPCTWKLMQILICEVVCTCCLNFCETALSIAASEFTRTCYLITRLGIICHSKIFVWYYKARHTCWDVGL